jgi:hypothetical protein
MQYVVCEIFIIYIVEFHFDPCAVSLNPSLYEDNARISKFSEEKFYIA